MRGERGGGEGGGKRCEVGGVREEGREIRREGGGVNEVSLVQIWLWIRGKYCTVFSTAMHACMDIPWWGMHVF